MLPDFLQTPRKESFKRRFYRYFINIYPAIFGTGVKVLFVSDDWHEVHLRLGINFWTKNYVGTIFGGSMFSATDSFYMVMLVNILGKEFVVWDKEAHIKFKRPGKEKIYAKFHLSTEDIQHIRETAREKGEHVFELKVNWLNKDGKVIAEIDRFLYVATKAHYKRKMGAKGITV